MTLVNESHSYGMMGGVVGWGGEGMVSSFCMLGGVKVLEST